MVSKHLVTENGAFKTFQNAYLGKPENGKASNVLNVAKGFILHPAIGKSA